MKKYRIFLLLMMILSTGCAGKGNSASDIQQKNMNNISNKKVLMVIAPADFRDSEYFVPKKIFEESGLGVRTASIQLGQAIGADGGAVNIDLVASEASPEDFAAVVFIGGPGMKRILGDESLAIVAKNFYGQGKIVAAICVAPTILANAGIVGGIRLTAWPDEKTALLSAGAEFVSDKVVVDKNFITASGPEAASEFGKAVADKINNQQ